MPAQRPEETDILVMQAINAGDVEAAVALYEPNACFVAGPGTVLQGTEAIRGAFRDMMAGQPSGTIRVPEVVQSGDLALLLSEWTVTSTGADGTRTTSSGRGREVVRRQSDGTWKFVIDHPTGGGS
jgi:uncharacterized protein (TIGR02246 family)